MLRHEGVKGKSLGDIMSDGAFQKKVTVHAAIHELRGHGHKIDYDGRRYFLHGRGVSFTSTKPGYKASPVCLHPYVRSNKSPVKKVVVHQGVRPVVRPPQALTSRVAAAKDVFIVNPGVLSKVLKVVPTSCRDGILDLTKKVSQYNKVVRLYVKAQDLMPQV
jgi:hypothetical protein